MKARKILKGHRWFQNSCSCGPVHDPDAPRRASQAHRAKQEDRPAQTGRGSKKTHWARQMRLEACHYCGAPGGTIDHIIPRSQGGRLVKSNCVPACGPCNNWRKDADYEWFKTVGWKTRPFAQ